MSNTIFPDTESAGAVEIRDPAGVPIPQPEVNNGYVPPPEYVATCAISALPSNCDARIEPRQINAIVSELVAFAECLDTNGPWDCNSLKNLCSAFTTWVYANRPAIFIGDEAPPDPYEGMLWWEPDTLSMYVYDSSIPGWVKVNDPTMAVDGISIVGDGSAAAPLAVGIIDCGTW